MLRWALLLLRGLCCRRCRSSRRRVVVRRGVVCVRHRGAVAARVVVRVSEGGQFDGDLDWLKENVSEVSLWHRLGSVLKEH